MYSTTYISGGIILSSDICGCFFCKVMIVVVACVVSKSLDALVEVVIFLHFDFMYVYLFPALECTVWSCKKNNPMYVFIYMSMYV